MCFVICFDPKYFKLYLLPTKQSELDLAKEVNIKEHLYTFPELEQTFKTHLENGLSSSEAEIRLKRDGLNQFSPPKVTPSWVLLVKELTAGFAGLFWVAVIASLIVYGFEQLPQDVSYYYFCFDN